MRPAPAGARWRASSAAKPGLGFAEWRARLRAIDGLARLSDGASVAETAASVGYASPSAFSAMIHRTLGAARRGAARPSSNFALDKLTAARHALVCVGIPVR